MAHNQLRSLPQGFIPIHHLDIRDKKVLLKLNFWSLGLLIATWVGFSRLANLVHPQAQGLISFSINRIVDALIFAGVLLGITAITLLFHEALHGLFFRIFTKESPRYGFKGFYAFAAAPDWYLPKHNYLVTALAPFLGISILAILGLFFTNPAWALVWLWIFVFNASGSVGDLWVVWVIIRSPADVLICDAGDIVEIFSINPDHVKA